MIDEPTITITLNLNQARILAEATDVVTRLYLNQFDVLKDVCYRKDQPYPDYDEMRGIELQLKKIFSPELSSNASWGIYNEQVSNDSRTLFDLHQKIRYELAWYRNPLGGWTVDYDSFMQTDNENAPPEVTINTNDPNYHIHIDFFRRFQSSIKQMINKRGWQSDSDEVAQWIEACKAFALHEHEHITAMNTPLPQDEYLNFFNQYIDEEGYVRWKELYDN